MYANDVPGTRVSEGFPSECIELVPDLGFRWLCGEPVPADVRELLRTSAAPDPISSTVIPSAPYDPAPGPVLEVVEVATHEPGFGILEWGAGLLIASLMARALS